MGAVSFCHLTIERRGLSLGDLIWLPQSGRSPRPAQGRCADGGQHRRIYTRQKKISRTKPLVQATRPFESVCQSDHVANRDFIVECQNLYVRIRFADTCRLEPRRGQLTNKNSICPWWERL